MQRHLIPVTIPNGQSLSAEVNLGPHRLVGIIMSAAWTAADLSIQALLRQPATNPPAPVFGEVVDSAGSNLVLAAAPGADEYIALAPTAALLGLGRVKIRSGTAGAPVNQAADRSLTLVVIDES